MYPASTPRPNLESKGSYPGPNTCLPQPRLQSETYRGLYVSSAGDDLLGPARPGHGVCEYLWRNGAFLT